MVFTFLTNNVWINDGLYEKLYFLSYIDLLETSMYLSEDIDAYFRYIASKKKSMFFSKWTPPVCGNRFIRIFCSFGLRIPTPKFVFFKLSCISVYLHICSKMCIKADGHEQ